VFAFDVWAPAAFVLGLLLFPWLGRPFWRSMERGWRALAARRGLSVALVGLVSLAVNGAVALHRGTPVPAVTDEFAYLLSSDTFAHGRVTNPPHPLWPHFESEEIIQQPTYQAKYPPGQGLFLALGQALTGYPAVGVFLSLALACAATCWMLQAWVGDRWALVGGLLAALNPGLIDGWGQTYWGGAVAMLGGALLFGGMRRLAGTTRGVHTAGALRARDAAWMGLGCAILANSRPFEGLLACLVAGLGLLPLLRRQRLPEFLRRVLLPVALVMLPTALAMAYYNQRVTGSALVMPYQIWYRTYVGDSSMFKGMFAGEKRTVKPRVLRGARPLTNEAKQAPLLEEKRAQKRRQLIGASAGFFLPGVIALALLALPWALRDRFLVLALAGVVLVFVLVFSGSTIFAPHYSAPVTGLVFALLAGCLARLDAWRPRGRTLGKWILRAALASCVVLAIARGAREAPIPPLAAARQRMIENLEAEGGRHLVVVSYDPTRYATYEWVYNAADIDASTVAWARELDPPDNARLVEYFADRTLWRFDAETLELHPYPRPASGR